MNADGYNDLLVPLIGLGGAESYVTDINTAGQVVGSSQSPRGADGISRRRGANGHGPGAAFQVRAEHGRRSDQRRGPDRGHMPAFQNSRTPFLVYKGTMYDLATLPGQRRGLDRT